MLSERQQPVERAGDPAPPAARQRSFLFTRDPALSAEAGEDYAIRKVPYHWKRTPGSYAMVVFGTVTSVFGFALGGQLALAYGLTTTLLACAIGFLVGAPLAALIARQCCDSSIDIDLLSRGAGYGFLGSAVTAMIYGLNFLMYAGFEVAFLGDAIHAQWPGAPLWVLYLVIGIGFAPLNWYGVSQNDFVQRWTLPIFLVGLVWLFVAALDKTAPGASHAAVGVSTLLPAIAVILSNVAIQVLIVGDSARFIRKRQRGRVITVAVVLGIGGITLLLAPAGAIMSLHTGSANPGDYAVGTIGVAGLIWILFTQLRIQEGNYYSGSLSLVNFSARMLHWRPGRRFFLVVIGVLAFVLAQLDIVAHLTNVITFMGVFLWAWIGTLMRNLLLTARAELRTGTAWLEHRRGYLADWGVPNTIGVIIGSAVALPLAFTGWPEPYGGLLAEVVAVLLAPAAAAAIARLGLSEKLLARIPDPDWRDTNRLSDEDLQGPELQVTCGVCGTRVMKPDACTCPVTPGGVICSACCAAHATCRDVCKDPSEARLDEEQVIAREMPALGAAGGDARGGPFA